MCLCVCGLGGGEEHLPSRIQRLIRLLIAGSGVGLPSCAGELPCENASWATGEPLLLLACTPEGLCGFLLQRQTRLFDLLTFFFFLKEETFYKSAGIIHISPRDSYYFSSYARFGSSWRLRAGWFHPAASRWSWSCCVVHHSQMVRNHSRWCRSVILTACRVFVHERTNFRRHGTVWLFGFMSGWMQRTLSLQTFG